MYTTTNTTGTITTTGIYANDLEGIKALCLYMSFAFCAGLVNYCEVPLLSKSQKQCYILLWLELESVGVYDS